MSFEVRVPASTSNLGAGFDCFGLALKLYLTIRVRVIPNGSVPCRVRTSGTRENVLLPRDATNLIYRAMAYTATREQLDLPPVKLDVHNEIPLARGLGSSAAAIVGGIKLCGLLTGQQISDERIIDYATQLEGHPDNVAPSLRGGFVVNAVTESGNVVSVKSAWPRHIKVLVVSPNLRLETKTARAALPRMVKRADAVHNLQRTALFATALLGGNYDLLWEAMRDRLHQTKRESMIPGLAEILALPQTPGFIGVALSGAGPSVIALVEKNSEDIGRRIAGCFHAHKIRTNIRELEVDTDGCQIL